MKNKHSDPSADRLVLFRHLREINRAFSAVNARLLGRFEQDATLFGERVSPSFLPEFHSAILSISNNIILADFQRL